MKLYDGDKFEMKMNANFFACSDGSLVTAKGPFRTVRENYAVTHREIQLQGLALRRIPSADFRRDELADRRMLVVDEFGGGQPSWIDRRHQV